jgi:hypothetical protein
VLDKNLSKGSGSLGYGVDAEEHEMMKEDVRGATGGVEWCQGLMQGQEMRGGRGACPRSETDHCGPA